MKEFSIIIPHYNCAIGLSRLLKSIGIHENMQIIVIDDNSDEQNVRILNELEKEFSYVEFYKNTELKKSAGICRNIGIDHANGKWTIFADADDYFTENYYAIISNYTKCDEDMILFPPRIVSEKTGKEIELNTYLKYIDSFLKNKDFCSELGMRYKTSTVWSRMISTKVIKDNNVRCDETIVANDVCFAAKISYYCRKLIVDKNTIYCYTKSSETLTTTISAERYDIRVQVFIDYYNFLRKNLTQREFNLLRLNASGMLLKAALDGLGIQYIFKLFFKMKKSKIRILDRRILNIPFVIRKILAVSRDHIRIKEAYMDNKE